MGHNVRRVGREQLSSCLHPGFLTSQLRLGRQGRQSEQVSWAGELETEGRQHPPYLYPPPLHAQLKEMAGQVSGQGAGIEKGDWGCWHPAVTLIEFQYMKGAFPLHPQSPYFGPGFLP